MADRPILFSGPMVLALQAGTKTQTRRVVGPQPDAKNNEAFCGADGVWRFSRPLGRFGQSHSDDDRRSPYGQPGDRLWVRETAWIAPPGTGDIDLCNVRDNEGRPRMVGYDAAMDGDARQAAAHYCGKKTPSIYMPRWASRLLLEITSLRVERLHAIDEADAVAEGLSLADAIKNKVPTVRDVYALLWDTINGERACWKTNPWVWVVSFKVVRRG